MKQKAPLDFEGLFYAAIFCFLSEQNAPLRPLIKMHCSHSTQ